VAEYQDRFQALLPRAGRLDEAQRVQLFTAGLLPPLSHDVEIHNPQSLATAMSLARRIELRNSYAAPAPRAPQRDRLLLPTPAPRLALPAPATDTAPKHAPATVTVEGRPVHRLTQAEQEERRHLGLCYNYDEKFGRGHNRVCKRLFLLNSAIEDDPEDDVADEEIATDESPHISLHAIAGVSVRDTMQIRVSVGAAVFTVLLDSGSTHNFIAEEAALRSGLPMQRRPRLTATVANGERVTCPGVLRHAPSSSATTRSAPTSS